MIFIMTDPSCDKEILVLADDTLLCCKKCENYSIMIGQVLCCDSVNQLQRQKQPTCQNKSRFVFEWKEIIYSWKLTPKINSGNAKTIIHNTNAAYHS